jgi:DNA-binding response OmpR family regulator
MPEKILIVDDDVETLRLVGMMLQRQGYEIAAASNGSQALTMARSEQPDLIVLDVMMPDLDGYQVTHELRKDPLLADTPILMFTAKSQIDDKVAGYDAGVDDYLTKPVHPAELVAHIKALLSRTRSKPVKVAETPNIQGYLIGIVGSKGGVGCSTLALNLATSFAQLTKSDVIAAELRPGQGIWASDLGFTSTAGLEETLKLKSTAINQDNVEKNLSNTSFGVRLLLSSGLTKTVDFADLPEKLPLIAQALSQLSPVVILDIGNSFLPGFDKLCEACKEIIVVTEPQPSTIKRTQMLLEELRSMSSGTARLIDVVIYNRTRSDIQLSSVQVSEMMGGVPVNGMIPPAPELAHQASLKHVPLVVMQPDGLVSMQIAQVAKFLQTRIGK